MSLVKRRISDPHLLRLIQGWLRAGVMEDGKYYETDGLGTPQGGVISPLLANIYLHSFDKMFQLSGIPGTLVRYCDDFVILLRRAGKQVLSRIKQMLGRLGLELHPDKTKIAKAEKGFDFLGMHFRLRIFLKRKYNDPSRGTKRVLDNLPVRLGLCQFGGLRYFNDNGC
jgi:retron-type reverse transcriptase